jgi:short-subunit dehydrogenase
MNVVITGASRGIGRAITEIFAKKNNHLIITSRSLTKETWPQDLENKSGCRVSVFDADLSVKDEVISFASFVKENSDQVDILVNNAGFFEPGSVLEEEDGVLERTLRINLNSAYHLTRALVPEMKKHKQGFIFNICSISALGAYPNGGSYSISKWALLGFNNNLREELKKSGIRVTAVHPGATFTDSWKGAGVDPKRIMEAGDIAKLIENATTLSPQACVEEIIVRPQLGDL